MFEGPDLRVVLEMDANKAIDVASKISDEQVLSSSVEELVDMILSAHDMEVPVLLNEEREVTETGSGQSIELHVPFTGTPGLLYNQPNLFGGQYPDGQVVGNEVVVPLGPPDANASDRADRWAALAQNYLNAVEHDVGVWRENLRQQLHGWVTRRRREAERHQEGLQQIGIPIRRRGDAPSTYTEPAIVKRKAPTSGKARGQAGAGDPRLSDEYYEHILFVIRAAGKAMERSPATYEDWGEEDRRQVLILMLNTHYAGKVHAEAFNGDGKTDILIREEDRNVFIGECKFYDGPKTVTDTLDQIFGYATWRDVKLAIIFFVNRKGFTQAVERIKETVRQSAQFRDWLPVPNDEGTEFRAQMSWPGDDQRLVTLHVSSFNTPRPEEAQDDATSVAEAESAS